MSFVIGWVRMVVSPDRLVPPTTPPCSLVPPEEVGGLETETDILFASLSSLPLLFHGIALTR